MLRYPSFSSTPPCTPIVSTMGVRNLLDITKQFTFYGAYHSNPVNVTIHIICVPILLWTGQLLVSFIDGPHYFSAIKYTFTPYLIFRLNWTTILMILFQLYYFALEPVAGLIYLPQLVLSVLTATAFSTRASSLEVGALLHVAAWIAQFIGHGVHEKRAPALLDNIFGAFVLAPFFVHLELLFKCGYRPELHKKIRNDIGREIAQLKKAQGDKKRSTVTQNDH